MGKPRVIYWFRTDLRLHDSPALKAALDLQPECLYPIWTWDPHYVYRARVGSNRWQFLLECQRDLSKSISKINPKSKLLLMREAPDTLFPKLFKAWKISHLVFEKDSDGYGLERDIAIRKLAEKAGVEVVVRVGRTLYDSEELVKLNGGKPTMTINTVMKLGEKIGEIPRPIPPPKSLPDPGDTTLEFDHEQPPANPDLNARIRESDEKSYEKISGPKGDFAVPTMEELGIKPATTKHHGGETIALKLLADVIKDKKYTATFAKPKTAPTDFNPQSTTFLSPHFHFGSLSVRELYWQAKDIVDNYKGATQPPTSLIGQILFRDMYFGAQHATGRKFGQTYGNAYCRFIPWHLRSKVDKKTGYITDEYEIDSPQAEEWFQRWKTGRTGFPWIDAAMRQLIKEGWIHHLARHAVACFLTRGGCYISWERGAEVFEEYLLDHEAACNAGNWQWLSCTAFFSQFYRCYSPVAFPTKWDKTGQFVREYCPELAKFPDKYIYEPWKAPIADQKKAGCLIQGDGLKTKGEGGMKLYPKPIFDFPTRREFCLNAMKKAYDVGLHGDDEAVKDGSFEAMFEGEDDDIDERGLGYEHTSDDGERADDVESEDSDAGNAEVDGLDQNLNLKKGSLHQVKRKAGDKGQTKLDFRSKRQKK